MDTNCRQYEKLFTGYLNKELSPAQHAQLDEHLAACFNCREELAAMQQLWDDLGAIPTPAPDENDMRERFQDTLAAFKAEQNRYGFWQMIADRFEMIRYWQPRFSLAGQLAVIILSFACGYLAFNAGKGRKQDEQLQVLSSQMHDLKQTMALALLENPSASERIRGVSYTSQMKHAGTPVIEALLTTLNNDPNVNVRLSTLDALTQLADKPEVREGLIRSITQQESPLMQSAIADVMLKLQEKRAVGSFKQLLKQKGLDNGVREKIKETINSLI